MMRICRLLLPALALALSGTLLGAEPEKKDRKPVLQTSSGVVHLHARDARVHGDVLRYEPEPHKNCLGFWTQVSDWAEWTFEITEPGEFVIEIWQGCGTGQGGSEVIVETAGRKLPFTVEDTGHFQNFKALRVGQAQFKTGRNSLAVKPQTKKARAIMDIREIRLIPVALAKEPAGD